MCDDADLDLLARWEAGDSAAGNALTLRYFVIVRAYFVTKAPHDYEDLVQETFSRLLIKRESFQHRSSFRVFLFGIAHMVLLEHFRARRRDRCFDPMESTAADLNDARPSSLLAERERHRLLFDALRGLKLREQELLELYYFQRLTAGEIARLHEAPEPTVRTRIRAAIRALAKGYQALADRTHDDTLDEGAFEKWMKDIQIGLAKIRIDTEPE